MSSRPALDPALLSHLISAQRLEDRRGRRGSGIPAIDRLLGGGWPKGSVCLWPNTAVSCVTAANESPSGIVWKKWCR